MEDSNFADGKDDLAGRFLTFYIDDIIYSLPLTHVIEIIGIQTITHIPAVPHYIKGIVNLRGKVVPISDVRLKFNQPERPYDDKTCIVITMMGETQVGLIVDRVAEVVTLEKADMAPPPAAEARLGQSYLASISKMNEKVIMNIDCEKLFQNDLAELFTPDN